MTQYNEVKRYANVGERIKIVQKAVPETRYDNGDEFTVSKHFGNNAVVVDTKYHGRAAVYPAEYVVLEPITQPPVDFRTLLADFLRQNPQASVELRLLLDEVNPQASAECSNVAAETFDRPTGKPPLLRSEVITKARADVAELLRIGTYGDKTNLPPQSPFYKRLYTVKVRVNREKRAVVCEILGSHSGKKLAKGIALCSPDDVFHADIGKAIALRRALGLAVPSEYISAPKPDKAGIGAIIRKTGGACVGSLRTVEQVREGTGEYTFTAGFNAYIANCAVIDDTDVDYSAD